MFRIALCLIIAFCFVPIASADAITAGYSGCQGGGSGSCAGGAYLLSVTPSEGGPSVTWTFDYSIPNADVKQMTSLDDVVVNLEVFDTKNGQEPDGAKEGFKIYLLVGGVDFNTADYHLLLDKIGPTKLDSYTGNSRDTITETVTDSADLARFLKQLQKNHGDFSVEVVAINGDFYLGDRHQTPEGGPARFAALDFETPEPASLGTAGIGLLALCWTLRKKIAR